MGLARRILARGAASCRSGRSANSAIVMRTTTACPGVSLHHHEPAARQSRWTDPSIGVRCISTPGLTPEQRSKELDDILSKSPGMGWELLKDRDAIHKVFNFTDFKSAFRWMGAVARYAEEMNHHPEWFNIYNRVEVILTTHDANGLSENDLEMASKMDQLEAELLSSARGPEE